MNTEQYCFIHIAKTAGTAIHRLMFRNLGPILFYDPLRPSELVEDLRQEPKDFLDGLSDKSPVEIDSLREAISEHAAVGGHSDIRIIELLNKNKFVFTSLRDPIDRLISYYYHYVYPEREKHRRQYKAKLQGVGFEGFLNFPKLVSYIDNHTVRVLSAYYEPSPVGKAQLAIAKSSLEHFDAVLFQDHLVQGVEKINQRTGWVMADEILEPSVKVGGNRQKLSRGDEKYSPSLERLTRFDYALYDHAIELENAYL